VKFERVVFEIRERTDRETDIQTCSSLYFTLLLGGWQSTEHVQLFTQF